MVIQTLLNVLIHTLHPYSEPTIWNIHGDTTNSLKYSDTYLFRISRLFLSISKKYSYLFKDLACLTRIISFNSMYNLSQHKIKVLISPALYSNFSVMSKAYILFFHLLLVVAEEPWQILSIFWLICLCGWLQILNIKLVNGWKVLWNFIDFEAEEIFIVGFHDSCIKILLTFYIFRL